MLEWKEYKSEPLEEHKQYLVIEGDIRKRVFQVIFFAPFYEQWQYVFQDFGPDFEEVTHYAEINLPEGDR